MKYSTPEIVPKFNLAAYHIHEKIGEGGFGHVYKAKQITTGQSVAIKFLTLSPEFDAEKKRRYIDRFERETELVSRLQHPNVVRLLDKGRVEDERLYAVFEYVEGLTLKDMLGESGALSPIETADVMAQVLDALVHANEKGVIHRDLKPANIMLSKVGAKTHAKILDFGIGSLTKEARQLEYKTITLTQETLGTPSYSAPEQLRGEPPTPKTDLYVWGLVFLECLTGQPAISGGSLASIFHKQLSPTNVPLPPAVVGHPVADLLRRVLNKKSNERVANAEDVYDELKEINLSTLVGDLQLQSRVAKADSQSSLGFVNDETIINDTGLLYTGLVEKKQITVLAVNVAIQSLSEEQGDFEVSDSLQRDQQNQCIDIAIRYGAFHAGTLAGSMVFYFGYPVVSDNDSRLCARSALEIASSINQKNALLKQSQSCKILVRMGMHTGTVMTYADAIPDGDTINIAMELAYGASPKQVLCSDSSKKLLDTYIEFKPDGVKTLGTYQRGKVQHLLVGERIVEAVGFLRGNRSNYAFVGREQELDELLALLDVNSQYSTAHVYGEAGIGKSRLIYELRNRVKDIQHTIAQCLPEHKYNALSPIFDVLKRKYSLDVLNPESAIDSLRDALSTAENADERVALPLLCAWLHLPFLDGEEVVMLPPEVQKEILFEALVTLLIKGEKAVDQGERSLFIIEDLHWADPTTIEFITYLLKHPLIKNRKTIFISTSRKVLPESIATGDHPPIEITGLTEGQVRAFIVSLLDKNAVSEEVLEVVISRTDGIPLFIEELVNMLLHRKLVQHLNGIFDFAKPDELDEVPGTLLELLQQKLDTLTCAKETAQLAATIGRGFDYSLLVMSSDNSEEKIQADLNELVANELVYRQRQVGGDSYLFKHALVRDAAYDSMLSEVKIGHHDRIAKSLIEGEPDSVQNISQHLAGAKRYQEAIDYGMKAIDLQMTGSANEEAKILGEKIMSWVAELPSPVERLRNELTINNLILPVYMSLYGFGHQYVLSICHRSESIIDELGDDHELEHQNEDLITRTEWALFLNYHFHSRRSEAVALGLKMISKADETGNRTLKLAVLPMLGQAHHVDGNLLEGKKCCEEALGLYVDNEDGGLANFYGLDPKCAAFVILAHIESCQGDGDKAKDHLGAALDWSNHLDHKLTMNIIHSFFCLVGYVLQDKGMARQGMALHNEKFGETEEKHWGVNHTASIADWAYGRTDYAEKYRVEILDSGQSYALSFYECPLIETYLEKGEITSAITLIDSSLNRCHEVGENWALPQLYRLKARAYWKREGQVYTDDVDVAIMEANGIARKYESTWFELLSAIDYFEYQPSLNGSNAVTDRMVASIDISTYINITGLVDKINKIKNRFM